MHKLLLTATALVLFASSPVWAEDEKKGPWAIDPDPSLLNVLILGDSISIGYTQPVRKLLDGKANVFRPHTADGNKPENCSGTTKGVGAVDRWVGDRKWDVIHFNFGLHDLKHVTEPGGNKVSRKASDPLQADVDQYTANLKKIVERLKKTGATLIFATTTPVPPGTSGVLREPESPPKYNAAAVKIMQEHGIQVNDLFEFCEPRLADIQRPKNVHFTNGRLPSPSRTSCCRHRQGLEREAHELTRAKLFHAFERHFRIIGGERLDAQFQEANVSLLVLAFPRQDLEHDAAVFQFLTDLLQERGRRSEGIIAVQVPHADMNLQVGDPFEIGGSNACHLLFQFLFAATVPQ